MELSRWPQSTHVHGIVAACVWRCLRRESTQATAVPHATHASEFSPEWEVFWCIFKALFWMKHLPQVSQLKGRSPVCVRWWLFRVSVWLKLLPQVSHLNGFSPVCMRRWRCRLPCIVKLLLQYWQLYALSPVWTIWCIFRQWARWKLFPHCSQRNGRTSAWRRWWFLRSCFRVKPFPQTSQVCGLSPVYGSNQYCKSQGHYMSGLLESLCLLYCIITEDRLIDPIISSDSQQSN